MTNKRYLYLNTDLSRFLSEFCSVLSFSLFPSFPAFLDLLVPLLLLYSSTSKQSMQALSSLLTSKKSSGSGRKTMVKKARVEMQSLLKATRERVSQRVEAESA